MKSCFRLLFPIACGASAIFAQRAARPGQAGFERNCGVCHGGDGLGGEMGPNIANRLANLSDDQLSNLIRDGVPNRGMPGFPGIGGDEKTQLMAFLRTIRPRRRAAPVRRTIELESGAQLSGLVMNESPLDLQMRTDDNRIHLLRPAGSKYREVTSESDWPTYNGDTRGNRYSTLSQITPRNVSRLTAKWIFTLEGATSRGQTTPVVAGGIMYVTSGNECWALDAGAGREIWHFQRPRTKGLAGNGAGGFNRGVATLGDSIFMVTDNAHLIALNRFTGDLLWETVMADWHQNYNATSAPLVVGDLVVTGTAGGEQGARGFVAAFNPRDGKEVWRFWTVPRPGEPGSETWGGKAIEHPSGVAWLTGSYDPELDTLYWATGNPGPDYNGEERKGDNLYTCSILALEPRTGKLKWYYQTTPHDVHDWDATEPLVLVDREWRGAPRKLLIQANRNGFFYVIDRENGKVLLAKPFIENINWAKELGPDNKPVPLPLPAGPTPNSTLVCPSQDGATNWFSSTYDPRTGYYIVQTFEKCSIYATRPTEEWQAGRGYAGGSQRGAPNDHPRQILRAIDVTTGKVVWELPEVGAANSWGGTLGFSTGVLFFTGDGGILTAIDSATGKPLWHFQTSAQVKASPMTYTFDGKQYIALDAGQNIIAFSLME
ncbi:MAG: PQQ-binding-like beta-propeller repeat protein [Acidobacteriota bacterium]|nr:PQQ-binding-like beta-propeller repeat protein [Acidobacteriota bacterium]